MKKNQSNNQTFDKFKSKLTLEAVINSIMWGLSSGFIVGGLISLICWLCGYKNGVWIALGGGVVSAIVMAIVLYFYVFRPTIKQTGRRVDSLGLQERTITMFDNLNNDSYIAVRQRADAAKHIFTKSEKALKIVIPTVTFIVLGVSIVFGGSFGVVSALYNYNVVSSPITDYIERESLIEVTYIAEDGGEIVGETDQIILPGENATTVTAVAMDGYMFMGWDDGNNNPSRTDLNITENLLVTAMFEPIEDGDGAEDGDFDGPGEGDEATDQPADGEGQGQGGEGDGSGSSGDSEGSGSGEDEGEGKGDGQGDGAGGKWGESNKIIDGNTYYRDKLDEYYQDAIFDLESRDDIPPELRDFIEDYYGSV